MRRATLATIPITLLAVGCGGPDRVNVELRKDRQELRDLVEQAQRENAQLRSQLRAVESADSGTAATLPQDRLGQLFTTGGVAFGRLTRREGDALKVYLNPQDGQGDSLKAAGAITVDAFDLAADDARLQRWQFPLGRAKDLWRSGGLTSGYVLDCPLDDPPPAGREITVKVTFTDGLTGRVFEATRAVE